MRYFLSEEIRMSQGSDSTSVPSYTLVIQQLSLENEGAILLLLVTKTLPLTSNGSLIKKLPLII